MTTRPLTPTMRTALLNALADREHSFSRLTASVCTVDALIASGLAYRSLGDGPVLLAPAGDLVAARMFDQGRAPLRRGDLVIYHGSLLDEHGQEYLVTGVDERGRCSLVDTYNGSTRLGQVQRESVSRTGQRIEPDPLEDYM